MKGYRIVLADDHPLFRAGIKRIIDERPGWEIVGEAGDGLELLRIVKEANPDLVVLDISMPHVSGLEAITQIKRISPTCKSLVLTMHRDREYLHYCLQAGVRGYLLKEDKEGELLKAIEAIRAGMLYISPSMATEMASIVTGTLRNASRSGEGELSPREREVLRLIAEGKTSKEVADLLCISPRTVQHHRYQMMRKLSIRTSAELIKYAIRKGYAFSGP